MSKSCRFLFKVPSERQRGKQSLSMLQKFGIRKVPKVRRIWKCVRKLWTSLWFRSLSSSFSVVGRELLYVYCQSSCLSQFSIGNEHRFQYLHFSLTSVSIKTFQYFWSSKKLLLSQIISAQIWRRSKYYTKIICITLAGVLSCFVEKINMNWD